MDWKSLQGREMLEIRHINKSSGVLEVTERVGTLFFFLYFFESRYFKLGFRGAMMARSETSR